MTLETSRLVSIVASRPRKFKIGAYLIMRELKTDYSHVSWIFWNTDRTRPRYYEAIMRGGVTFTGVRHWEGRNLTVFRKDFEISELNYEILLDKAMDKCGEEYGFLQNLGIKLNKIFSFGKNIFSDSQDKSNCSELIFDFKDFVGLEISGDPDLITPKDIIENLRGK